MAKPKGKFWPRVRTLIWEKAQQLYQMEQAKTMGNDFKGITATRKELREGGYFYTSKLIVLRNLWRQRKGLPTLEEEETYTQQEQTITKILYCHLKTRNHKIINKKEAGKKNV